MAKSGAVWGIDIGQCALKALRCRLNDTGDGLVAEAFDFIEYPKILSQPEADPVELVRDALAQFLSRNEIKGDRVAISVSGQNGLARFIKLPPVESKKIPDIVKYEARQQIPFALEDVVWDYQQMAGGSEEDGFALETEVGLFAMKRDQVFRALRPFNEAGIEVDIVQLAPLALYNFVCFEHLQDLPPPDQFDSSNPPPSMVVLSLGTDTTDLVVTNGYRVWQRSVPLGGNHFTKALTKELKLTFAKAEHLKRNATKAEDPKAVFQAMRPVFNDLVTEIHRSLSFFSSLDRSAKIGRVITLGNVMKLRGLQKYLSQNLGYEVSEATEYSALAGPVVMSSPAFKDNLFSFGVCYGLCVQGVGKAQLSTNLLPQELLKDRLIRAKKPWAVAAVAALLLGCSLSYLGGWWSWSAVRAERYKSEFSEADRIQNESKKYEDEFAEAETKLKTLSVNAQNLSNITDRRDLWLELLAVVNRSLPKGVAGKELAPLADRGLIYIDSIDYQPVEKLEDWVALESVQKGWKDANPELAAKAEKAAGGGDAASADGASTDGAKTDEAPAADGAASEAKKSTDESTGEAAAPADGAAADGSAPAALHGPGFIVNLKGHFYSKEFSGYGFLREQLVKPLLAQKIKLPIAGGGTAELSVRELGLDHPTIVEPPTPKPIPPHDPSKPAPGASTTSRQPPVEAGTYRFDFVLEFGWQPTPASERGPKGKKKQTPADSADSTDQTAQK